MAEARIAIERTLKHEGGYADDPDDPGGETNFGISKRSYPSEDIKNLTREQAIAIYQRDYWIPLWDRIESQDLADCLFDFGVNSGIKRAVESLQRALSSVVVGPLIIDGVFGIGTLAATNHPDSKRTVRAFVLERLLYYASLNKPKYTKGWFRRALSYWI